MSRLARAAAALLLCTLPWAASGAPAPGTSPSPAVPWSPPPGLALPLPAVRPPGALPPELSGASTTLSLAQLVDLGLRTSSRTRQAWEAAPAREAAAGVVHAAWYPQVGLDEKASKLRGTTFGGKSTYQSTSGSTGFDVSWLLFDGGRRASADEAARQALVAANWAHDAAIQDVVLDVERAYYEYVGAKDLLSAQESAVKDAGADLDAANARHDAGIATASDVLEARTTLASAHLATAVTRGTIARIRGALATSVGLPPDTPYDVADPPEDTVEEVRDGANALIAKAMAGRPDLAAARAGVAGAEAGIRAARATDHPLLTADATSALNHYPDSGSSPWTWSTSLALHFPVSTGRAHAHAVAEATAEAEVARASLEGQVKDVISEVWSDRADLDAAAERVSAATALVDSASQAHDVAAARYKAGVGSILDALSAEAALEGARAQLAAARNDWHLARAALAHDTGAIDLGHAATPTTHPHQDPP